MMKTIERRFLGALLGVVMAGAAQAEFAGVQFSADMVSRAPDGQTQTGRMYVGDGRIRIEMTQDGQQMVRISDQNRHMEWMLLPDRQTYMERGAPPGTASAAPLPTPSAAAGPCAGNPTGVTCRRVGEEPVNGRPAIRWEVAVTHEGQTIAGTQWLDVQRGLPLRQTMPNGQSMELRMLGTEEIQGRSVEKWEMTASTPGQQPTQTLQWYDPQLKLSVREEFPGGYVRELGNIRVGEQPDHLFTVPAGYTRMELPQGGATPPSR